MRKFSIASLITGILIGAIIFGGVFAFAASVTADRSTWRFLVDGKPVEVEAYIIAGSNYLKLRDVFEIADVGVWYDGSKGEVYIERDKGYDANYSGPSETATTTPTPTPTPTPSTSPTPAPSQTPTPGQNPEGSHTVYWVPNGVVYHLSMSCRSLAMSKDIRSGTIAESGKPRVCSICG